MAGSCSISVTNNAVLNESGVNCFDILRETPKLMTRHSNFPLRAARDTAARGNDTTVHNNSHQQRGIKQLLLAAGKRWPRGW